MKKHCDTYHNRFFSDQITSITAGPRQTNIECLRILAMFLVLTVHAAFWATGAPTIEDFNSNPLGSFTKTFIESISICCVDVFILISGWFGIRPTAKGFCNFLFQCAYFLIGIYAVFLLFGLTKLSLKGIAEMLGLYHINWFIPAYAALYIFSPILNTFVEKANKRTSHSFLHLYSSKSKCLIPNNDSSTMASYPNFNATTSTLVGLRHSATY